MPTVVRVLTYNILLGGHRRELRLGAVLERARADVIALQEASDLPLVRRLAVRLGMRMVVGRPSDAGRLNLVLLTRIPVTRWRNHRHPGNLLRTHLECELDVGGRTHSRMRIHSVHLAARFGERANGEERRMRELGAVLGDIERSGRTPHIILGDFNAVAPGDTVAASRFFTRMAELRRAGLWVRGLDGLMAPRRRTGAMDRALDEAWAQVGVDPALDVGVPTLPWMVGPLTGVMPRRPLTDRVLNRFIDRRSITHLSAHGYRDCYRSLHDDEGYTCATWMPAARIDYIFADTTMARSLRSCDVIGGPRLGDPDVASASDHFPVVAEFRV